MMVIFRRYNIKPIQAASKRFNEGNIIVLVDIMVIVVKILQILIIHVTNCKVVFKNNKILEYIIIIK